MDPVVNIGRLVPSAPHREVDASPVAATGSDLLGHPSRRTSRPANKPSAPAINEISDHALTF